MEFGYFRCNQQLFEKILIFNSKDMLGILELRLMGYYKIKQRILLQNSSKYYRFKSADMLCEEFNAFINTLKKNMDKTKEKYPWIEPDDWRKNMPDKEILDEHIDLDKSCLTDSVKKQVIDMLYKCKDAFSLRDEIGTFPNIEVEIDVTDKSPFFFRQYHVKEEDKKDFR